MTVRLIPVHDFASEVCVDLIVHWTVGHASEGYSGDLDSVEDGLELSLCDSEAIVTLGELFVPLVEVDGQTFVDVNCSEGSDSRGRPIDTEDRGQLLRSGPIVLGRNHEVVEVNHGCLIARCVKLVLRDA
jgi:hypothetical protein